LALARSRIMGARYPYYLLADSVEGQMKEAELTQTLPSDKPVYNRIRHGFVYERVPHITLKSIANNTKIDVIWEKRQTEIETGGRQGKTVDSLRRVHAQEPAHGEPKVRGDPWGGTKGMDPESDTL
jgi:hypothetical protein